MSETIDVRIFLPPPLGYEENDVNSNAYINSRKVMSVSDSYSLLNTLEKIKNNTYELPPEAKESQKRNALAVTIDRVKSIVFSYIIYIISSQSHYLVGIAYCMYFLKEQLISLFKCGSVFKAVAPSLGLRDIILHKIAYILLHLLVIYLVLNSISKKGYLPIHLADYVSLFSKRVYNYYTVVGL